VGDDPEQEDIIRFHPSRIGQLRLLRPLAERDFRLLWLGESISVFGNRFQGIALAWLILEELGSGLVLGTVMMAAAIPFAVFMLFGGVLSDRLSPRRVMLISNASRCILVAVLASIVFARAIELWHVYVFAVTFGFVGAFFLPAMMAMIPRVVGRERLEASNSLVQGSMHLSGLVGPALAGVVVAVVGTAAALGVDAATFAFATVTLWLMKPVNHLTEPAAEGGALPARPVKPGSALTDITNGLRYAWGHAEIRALLPAIVVMNLSFVGPITVGLVSQIHSLTGKATALGTVVAVAGGAALVGSLLAGTIKLGHRGILMIVANAVLGAGFILLGLARSVLSISLLLGVVGILNGFVNIKVIAWLQGATRPDMLARVMSLVMFASAGLQPVSFALAGTLVDLNPTLMFAGAGGLMMVTCFYLAACRAVRTID